MNFYSVYGCTCYPPPRENHKTMDCLDIITFRPNCKRYSELSLALKRGICLIFTRKNTALISTQRLPKSLERVRNGMCFFKRPTAIRVQSSNGPHLNVQPRQTYVTITVEQACRNLTKPALRAFYYGCKICICSRLISRPI